MIITIASGKGGTGKTTVATSLALCLADSNHSNPPIFLDCDVEAPNAHIFLKPSFEESIEVSIPIPKIDENTCTFCGVCADVCQYNAIAVLDNKVLVFPQLCHGCGLCTTQCPEKSITEIPKRIGIIEKGYTKNNILFYRGLMDIGEAMAIPIIRQLKKAIEPQDHRICIIDAPPGASCPVVESARKSDFILLVTEPTPFGLHDLKLAYQLTQELQIPAGVIINRYATNDYPELTNFCKENNLPIFMKIPFDRTIAEGISKGYPLIDIYPEYRDQFIALYNTIESIIGNQNETTRDIKR